MKTFCLTTMIFAFLLLCTNGAQAQTTQTKLNQIELMKQFVGNWKCDYAKDTTVFVDIISYGTGFEDNFKFVTKGNTVNEGKELLGYDKKADKLILSSLDKKGDITIYAFWFISKTKYLNVLYNDISNPEKASFKLDGEFKSPDLIVETITINNKPIKTNTYTRIKQ